MVARRLEVANVSSQAAVAEPRGLDRSRLIGFVSRSHGADPSGISLDIRPLRGGLEAAAVARVGARWRDAAGRSRGLSFVAKRLEGSARREAELYTLLQRQHSDLTPRPLGVEQAGPTASYLYLEYVRQARAWPWREVGTAAGVLGQLARLHASTTDVDSQTVAATWDYEAELRDQAHATLVLSDTAVRAPQLWHLRTYGPPLRRLVSSLPRLRQQLTELQPFGKTVLHGDVHSRNVVLRARAGREQAVFIDWGRARVGSPLEDVSSWLESLGGWEHEVRRRHDTLLRQYLRARGFGSSLERTFRDAYWLASVSNSLSGALYYHLAVATDVEGRTERERTASTAAARLHLRVMQRADALWRA